MVLNICFNSYICIINQWLKSVNYNRLQLSPEGEVNSGGICQDAKRRGMYLALWTDPEGDSCFSIYQIS